MKSSEKCNEKVRRDPENMIKCEKSAQKKYESIADKKVSKSRPKESLVTSLNDSPAKRHEVMKTEIKAEQPGIEVEKKSLVLRKSPEKIKIDETPEKAVDEKSHEKINRPTDKIKVELKIERKKSPKRIEKPKVNIFLEDSDELDEFETSIERTIVKSKWSSPEIVTKVEDVPQIVPAPTVELKRTVEEIPVVIESPERSPILPVPLIDSIFESSSVTISKSPTPSPPPKPNKVRNVCSFLSDIASGNIFSGLGLGSGLYDDGSSITGLNLNDYKAEPEVKLQERRKFELNIKLDVENFMEPDTTAEKLAPENTSLAHSNGDTDSDESDSDTSSSSDSDSDDTTSESEESTEESSDDEVPSFTRGFGRFDASSMPMVTQIKTSVGPTASITPASVATSRFQPHHSASKSPGLVTNIVKSTLYNPSSLPVLPTVTTPFTLGLGPLAFPIPFKIYSLRDQNNCNMVFPTPVQPAVTHVLTPSSDKAEKDKKALEKDKHSRDRRRSRSHSREKDKKRVKDDRRKSPPRKRSPSPIKKRHIEERGRQQEERKDTRRRDPSPRHSSRASHMPR